MEKKNEIIEEESQKKTIELYQVLKDRAYAQFNNLKKEKKISISQIEKILETYDVDPNINNFYLEKCLEYCSNETEEISKDKNEMDCEVLDESKKISPDDFYEKYLHYINSLSLNQKKNLNEKIKEKKEIYQKLKNIVNNDSNLEKIHQIFQSILGKDLNLNEFENHFSNKYFINIEAYHIPLIYGTNELRYSGIIYELYSYFFLNKIAKRDIDHRNIYQKIYQYKKNIIEKKTSSNTSQKNEKTEKQDSKPKRDEKEDRISYLKYFLKDINYEKSDKFLGNKSQRSEDDLSNFNEGYILNDKISFVYYKLLYLNLILYCFQNFGNITIKYRETFRKLFESRYKKAEIINYLKDDFKAKVIENKENILEEKIICYNTKNLTQFFEFNPNEYILENIQMIIPNNSNFSNFKNQFKNEDNYSLYKHYKNNHLFYDKELNNIYNENIISMLRSKIISKAYDEFSSYQRFKNPFQDSKSKDIIELINRIKYYIYFPLKNISGLTFKTLGIIFINKYKVNIDNNDDNNDDNKLIYFSINISYKKLAECREIIAHYILTLCRGNSKNFGLLTSNDTFLEYTSTDEFYQQGYDRGDKLECLLFGNKVPYLTIKSSLFILNKINWDLDSFELFRKYFQDYNTLLQESKVNLENELEIIDIIKAYIERFYIKKEKTAINLKKSNSYILFRKELDMEIEDISSDSDEDASYYERFSLTSNAFLPRKISISNIINENLNLDVDNEE